MKSESYHTPPLCAFARPPPPLPPDDDDAPLDWRFRRTWAIEKFIFIVFELSKDKWEAE